MKIERVDDIPLIIGLLEKIELSKLLNQYFPNHGNWKGLDGGKVLVGFLTYILSCADHRLSYVEPWVSGRLHILGHCLSAPKIDPSDFTDDRLGSLLDRISNKEQWDAFESAVNQSLIRVHKLPIAGQAIRLDAFIVQSFREQGDLFKMGYSKQHRSDLPQIKAMVATLDPLSMPLAIEVVSGEQADDGLYIPVIDKVNKTLDQDGLFYVGDAKLGSLENRSHIHRSGNKYLMPLSKKQCSPKQLTAYLAQKPAPKDSRFHQLFKDEDKEDLMAQAFEVEQTIISKEGDLTWTERHIVVHSTAWAEAQNKKLEVRLAKAEEALSQILVRKQRKRVPKTLEAVQLKVQQILQKYRVTDFFEVKVEQMICQVPLRTYKDRPATMVDKIEFKLHYQRNESAIEEHSSQLGWRVYATNISKSQLSVPQAVLCYRQEYKIEHKFNQLLNKVTALMPVFLKKDSRIVALTRLLLFALKFVSTTQQQVRKELQSTGQYLKELFPGNPGRKTNKPTTEMILSAFKDISLVILPVNDSFQVKVAKLKPVQLKILELLGFHPSLYQELERIPFFNKNFIET